MFDPRCRHPKCDQHVRPNGRTWCKKHWRVLLDAFTSVAKAVKKDAPELYIGRTHWPERRLVSHRYKKGYDHMCVLHWASDREEAVKLEADLIKTLHECLFRTRTSKSGPGGPLVGEWHALYLAWESRGRGQLPTTFEKQEVVTLDYGNRLLPATTLGRGTAHVLWTPLDAKRAGEVRAEVSANKALSPKPKGKCRRWLRSAHFR